MCGRVTLTTSPARIGEVFREFNLPLDLELSARFNVAPQQALLVVPNDGQRTARRMTWGLVPSWAKDAKGYQINARAETAAEKPFFRTAFRRRRCVVVADGFYEWAPGEGKGPKTPWYFRLRGGEPFAIAGLWDVWRSPDGEERPGVALLTTEANGVVAPVHGRMPVILPREAFGAWLSTGEADASSLLSLLRPAPEAMMCAWPVSRLVNAPKNDGPELVAPVDLDVTAKPAA
ncbi:MAG TPA: SOS response-associated peptidase [Polyangiaceae bacterium]|nr:SOS response-associated peptidase [Polyangiaceae bacterium]